LKLSQSLLFCRTSFNLSDPILIAETATATVWRSNLVNGQPVALKIYNNADMRNEAPGFEMLKLWQGESAARLFGRISETSIEAAVIEWLDGPSLGDLSRAGEDERSNEILLDVALRLHRLDIDAPPSCSVLTDTFDQLLSFVLPADWSQDTKQDFQQCQALAYRLITSQRNISALHGDLHHDNIRLGRRGYCAFDAKGLVGEKTFELANAFRNPNGMGDRLLSRQRIESMATQFTSVSGVDRGRLLNWACAKCAQSIVWRGSGVMPDDREFKLLSLLLQASAAES